MRSKVREWTETPLPARADGYEVYLRTMLLETGPTLKSVRTSRDRIEADGVMRWRLGIDLLFAMGIDIGEGEFTMTFSDLSLARRASGECFEVDRKNTLAMVEEYLKVMSFDLYAFIQGLPKETELAERYRALAEAERRQTRGQMR